MEAYTHVDYVVPMSNKRSTYDHDYYAFLCGNLVAWRSMKQSVVARSSAATKFRSMTQGVYELL